MTTLLVRGPSTVTGAVEVPGDKSISHRALMLAAVADGESIVRNLAPGDDVSSTVRCLGTYGVDIAGDGGRALIRGTGFRSWSPPTTSLDCGNSGTTMRMLAGFAAHYEFPSVLDGDASLRARPMERLVHPLETLGAHVTTTEGHAPLRVEGGRLSGATIETGIPSAQVKSSAIFAALAADGRTSVVEPGISRDHTERLLAALGAPITESRSSEGGHTIDVEPYSPPPFEIDVPGDPSSAAFLVTAAVLCGRVRIERVGLNPTRIGFLDAMARMGAEVRWSAGDEHMGEPTGTIEAERSDLSSIGLEGPLVPLVLDELPLVAVLATQARGSTTVTGAEELRVKESDRIATTISALRSLGADAEERPNGFTVTGPTPLTGTKVDAAGDHRLAMALAVAALIAHGETYVEGFEAAAVSWPGFDQVLVSLGADVELR